MAKLARSIVRDGGYCIIEHALCADMTSPSERAFTEMAAGEWTEDPDLESIPDDAQITQAQKLRAGIEWFAERGVPNNAYCTVNNLRDGIWEFRLGRVRISFYDTDGVGNYTPKLRVRDISQADPDSGQFWWLPTFDENVRLGHCFGKRTDKTEEDDIAATLQIREEDLEHDHE